MLNYLKMVNEELKAPKTQEEFEIGIKNVANAMFAKDMKLDTDELDDYVRLQALIIRIAAKKKEAHSLKYRFAKWKFYTLLTYMNWKYGITKFTYK